MCLHPRFTMSCHGPDNVRVSSGLWEGTSCTFHRDSKLATCIQLANKFLGIMTFAHFHRFVPRSNLYKLSDCGIRTFSKSSIRAEKLTTSPPPARTPPRRSNRDQLPIFPLFAIFVAGSGSFYFLAKSREGTGQNHTPPPERVPTRSRSKD